MKSSVVLFVLALVFSVNVPQALALPKFASRVGAKCQACHLNPTGKGMRNTFGSTYGREELPMRTYKTVLDTTENGKVTVTQEDVTNLEDFSTNLTPFFSYGADFRSLYFYDGKSKGTSFFQMQGDLYFDLRINKTFRVYLDKGLYSGFEVFGLAKVLPLDGYIKLGQFIPAYGTKTDDHNAFIRGGPYSSLNPDIAQYRQGLIFGQRSEQTGVEVGIAPGIFSLQVGLFNGAPNSGVGGTSATKYKAVAIRGDATIQSDRINANIGLSWYNDPNPSPLEKGTFYGAFGSVTVLKNLTFIAEFDYLKTPVAGSDTTGYIVYTEVIYMLSNGIDLKVGYDFYDPNKDLKTGSSGRITIGGEFFPMSGVELRPLYHINQEKPTDVSNNDFQLMFHFFL